MASELSPLEILDDEGILAALENLTLDDGTLDESASSTFGDKQPLSQNDQQDGEEPNGEHGTRSQFIKDVSERIFNMVNDEANSVELGKQLMHQYMVEFCGEYDRCGYGSNKNSTSVGGANSPQNRSCSDQTSTSTASVGEKLNKSSVTSQQQMAFDNQILKKGVRVLSKNIQRINEQNRVKDQQLKVMRQLLMHQKNQLTALQSQMGQQPSQQLDLCSSTSQLTGMMDSLNVNNANQQHQQQQMQTDSSMTATPAVLQENVSHVNSSASSSVPALTQSKQSLHLQSMRAMQNFSHNGNNPDIY